MATTLFWPTEDCVGRKGNLASCKGPAFGVVALCFYFWGSTRRGDATLGAGTRENFQKFQRITLKETIHGEYFADIFTLA